MKRFRFLNLLLFSATLFTTIFPAPAWSLEPVSMQLGWDHQYTYAGFYAAKWQGYYAEVGLDVEIRSAITKERKFLKAPIEVAEKRAEFGSAGAQLLVDVDEGRPLVVVASIFQQSPVAFFALKQAGLRSPADLLGLRVSRRVDDILDVEMQAMLRAEGIDPALVKPYPRERTLAGLVEDRVDVIPGFRILRSWEAQRLGIDIDVLYPSAYGIDFYGNSIITHRDLAQNRPELVKSFRDASLKGWLYALEHPEEIADRISTEMTRRIPLDDIAAFNRYEAIHLPKLILFPIVPLGNVNPERWYRMHKLLMESGVVKGELDLERLIFNPERDERQAAQRWQDIFQISFVLIFIVAVIGLSFAWILRRTVADRTIDLKNLNDELEQRVADRTEDLNSANLTLQGEIQERIQAEEELHEAQASLVSSERLATLGQLTATVSHELRNPLGVIRVSLHSVKKFLDDASINAAQPLARIERNIDRCTTIIEDMLEFTRLRSPELHPVQFDRYLSGILNEFSLPHEIKLQTRLDAGEASVAIDSERMRQAVINLLDNSVQAMASDSAENRQTGLLSISTRLQEDSVVLTVEDSGPGIPAGEEQNVFEPLFSTKSFGVGLGLAIIQNIIESHGGTINLDNREDSRGAIATVSLPRMSQ